MVQSEDLTLNVIENWFRCVKIEESSPDSWHQTVVGHSIPTLLLAGVQQGTNIQLELLKKFIASVKFLKINVQ